MLHGPCRVNPSIFNSCLCQVGQHNYSWHRGRIDLFLQYTITSTWHKHDPQRRIATPRSYDLIPAMKNEESHLRLCMSHYPAQCEQCHNCGEDESKWCFCCHSGYTLMCGAIVAFLFSNTEHCQEECNFFDITFFFGGGCKHLLIVNNCYEYHFSLQSIIILLTCCQTSF